MERRKLGASDCELTTVGLGAWALGGLMWGGTDARRAERAVGAALDAGVDWIDTAPAYGCGRSEEIVGRAVRGQRDRVRLATKCGLRWEGGAGEVRFDVEDPETGGRVRVRYDLRPASLRAECEASLRRLGVERIDLYLVHWPYPPHSLEDAFGELARLRDEGKVRWLGACNFTPAELEVAHRTAGIVCAQAPLNLTDRRAEAEVLPWCRANGIGFMAYSPMARGLLTGGVPPERAFPTTDHRSHNPAFALEWRARVAAALAEARPLAERHGVSLGSLAVAWALRVPGVACAAVGARTPEQARENARAGDVTLEPDEWERLAARMPQLPWAPSKPPASPQR